MTRKRKRAPASSSRKKKRTTRAKPTRDAQIERRRAVCEAWILDCASELMLSPMWTIKLLAEPSEKGAEEWAGISASGWSADITLSDEFWLADAEQQRSVIAHELGHLVMHPTDEMVKVHSARHKSWLAAYDKVSEDTAEFLERLLRDRLPLPPKFPKVAALPKTEEPPKE